MRKLALLAPALSLALHGIAEGEQAPRNAVPIDIYWSTGMGKVPLSNASFDDDVVGAIPFTRVTDHFRGIRETQGSWAFHDVTLNYGSDTAPLALRTMAGIPGLRIALSLPAANACRLKVLDRLRGVSEGATVLERINTMIEARHLLALRSNICPGWAKKDLAEIYFVMSCSLAKGTSYIRVPDEAKTRFRQLARDPASAEMKISSCDTQMLGTMVKSLHEASLDKLADNDFAKFGAINAELMAKAGDRAWGKAFEKQELDKDELRAELLRSLYRQQKLAASRRDYDEALEFNAKLADLITDDDFKQAFTLVSLTSGRLSDDRAFYETLKRPAQPDPQQ